MQIPFGKDEGTGKCSRAPPVSLLLGDLWVQPRSWPASPGPFLGTCYTREGNVPICGRPHRGYPVAKSRPGAAAPAIATADPPLQHTPALAAWLSRQLAWSQSCTLPREAGAQCWQMVSLAASAYRARDCPCEEPSCLQSVRSGPVGQCDGDQTNSVLLADHYCSPSTSSVINHY